jgi:hypothetical protein
VTGYSPEVEVLEHEGRFEEAMRLAALSVQSELQRVRVETGGSGSPAPATPQAPRAWRMAVCACKFPSQRHTQVVVAACPGPTTPLDPIGGLPLQVERNLADAAADSKATLKYALVIDGKALLYALSPMLRQLFLKVGGGCGCAGVLWLLGPRAHESG